MASVGPTNKKKFEEELKKYIFELSENTMELGISDPISIILTIIYSFASSILWIWIDQIWLT